MEIIGLLLTLASIHLGMVVIPGPNFLVIVKNSLAYSRHTGIITARGVASGTVIHVIAGFLGFTALLSQSVFIFNIVKWIGTLYFIYVGIQLIRTAKRQRSDVSIEQSKRPDLSDIQAYRSGLLTMLSNVKSAFYFMFLFTTFLPAQLDIPLKLTIIVLIPLISLTWYTILAFTFSNPNIQHIYQKIERWINYTFGFVWIVLGLRLMATNRN